VDWSATNVVFSSSTSATVLAKYDRQSQHIILTTLSRPITAQFFALGIFYSINNNNKQTFQNAQLTD